jgi:ribosome-binding factor A
MTRRAERISNVIRQEISELLQERINDPRLTTFISVTRVVTSADLSTAKIFVSAIGDNIDKEGVLDGFRSATGFLRREIAKKLTVRHVPEFIFQFDDSIEVGTHVLQLIEKATQEDRVDEHERHTECE